jgi:scyllo-inositol 2-dehydrogenase (NADP+)
VSDLNIGIIGFGRIGAEHERWISRTHGINAVAVCDLTPARRALAEGRGVASFENIEPILANPSIDAVLISTPTAMHFDHANRAMAAGKHVMIEKPMALELPQARQLVHEAKWRQRVLSVFHNRRWDVDYLTVKQTVAAGTLGRIINVESRISQFASCVGPAAREWHPNWRNEAQYGGGGLYDWGSHLIDQIWRLLWPARPLRVFAQLRGNLWSRDCDDFARVCIDFDSGAVAIVEINTTTKRPLPRWHIDGTHGSADSPFSLHYDTNEWAKLSLSLADGSAQHFPPRAAAGLTESDIWSRFAAAVRGEGAPAVTATSVLPTMCLLDAARRSSEDGAAVYVHNACDWEL